MDFFDVTATVILKGAPQCQMTTTTVTKRGPRFSVVIMNIQEFKILLLQVGFCPYC